MLTVENIIVLTPIRDAAVRGILAQEFQLARSRLPLCEELDL